jgi:hypothetical protein
MKIIQEEITSGSVIVYHRTGKGRNSFDDGDIESPVKGIAADGFRVGKGNTYGIGVYTTYNLESQLKPNMIETYGPIIIESKVLSLDNFLIFDYDIAKKIYGNKNYRLDKQLELIIGKQEWNIYKNNEYLNKLINELDNVDKSSDIAIDFYDNFNETIIYYIKGLIFTGEQDGNVLVSYDRKNVEPLRYSTDEGKTWINILDKNIYKRKKKYNKYDVNPEVEHLINKLEVGYPLNDDQIDIILNNKNIINNLDSNGIAHLFIHSEPHKVIYKLGEKGQEYINNLDSDGISYLLGNSTEIQKVIDIILSNKILINKLDSNGIKYLLYNSIEPQKVINKLGKKGKFYINNLNSNEIDNILFHSPERQKVINILLNNKNLIYDLDPNGIIYLIDYSDEQDKVKSILKQYRPDLKLESKINIKRIIEEEINIIKKYLY